MSNVNGARLLLAAVLAIPLWTPVAMAQNDDLAAPVPKIRDLLQAFVDANVATYKADTARLTGKLEGTVCEIGAGGLEALALPEPTRLQLTAFSPVTPSDTLRPGEHIDPRSVRVTYGHGNRFPARIAADAATADLLGLPDGLPVRVTASVFVVGEGECQKTTRRNTRNNSIETLIQKKRFSVPLQRRQVDITNLIGNRLSVSGGYSFDAQRHHVVPGSAGRFPFPAIGGSGARFDFVDCDGTGRQVFVDDSEPITPTYSGGSPASELEVVGLIGMQIGTAQQRLRRHLLTGPGTRNQRTSLEVLARVQAGNGEGLLNLPNMDAVQVDLRGGPLALGFQRKSLRVSGTGLPGQAELVVAPAGSTAGSLKDTLELTVNRVALRLPDRRPFVDDDFVVEMLIDGPLPANSGMKVSWTAEAGQAVYDRGELDVPTGGQPLLLPVARPSTERVVRAIGTPVVINVVITRQGEVLFSTVETVRFRPPPVAGIALVGRREGAEGGFRQGPFDLFRVEGAKGIEAQVSLRFRDGTQRSFPTPGVPAFGIQQSQGGGLLMESDRRRGAVVRARQQEELPQAALRPILRSSAASTTDFSPPPDVPFLLGDVTVFTLNDALLVIDNLGANGFVWRLLIDGDADMSRYIARYETSQGSFDERFSKDGASWVASRQFAANVATRHVAIVQDDGAEVARIDQGRVQAITPRISLDIPEIYRQGVSHRVTASVSGIGDLSPFDLACSWDMAAGFGSLSFATTQLLPEGSGFASCVNSVEMDINEATLGRFPTVSVRLVRLPKEEG
ncbi:MAG: hypothetical protein P1U65_17940 [Minwuia sp.]|nr:hypothetical protein [Minwuia sp.]